MGYGILVAGYLFLLSIPLHSMGVCAEIIGYVLMLRAFLLLKTWQKGYGRAAVVTVCLLPMGIYPIVLQAMRTFGAEAAANALAAKAELPYSIVLSVLLLLLHHFMLSATKAQAAEVELTDIVRQTIRNRIMTLMYCLLTIALNLVRNVPAVTEKVSYSSLAGVVSLFGIAWILLNAKMLFNCYMWICLPGDEDMPMRESKIPSIFKKEQPVEEDGKTAYERQKAEYNEAMRQRQIARTKKNKRHHK